MPMLFVDLGHLVRGSTRTEEAAEHVRAASDLLRSVESTAGMFGRTEAAANADTLLSQAHEQHLRNLGEHHRGLRWVGSRSADTAIAFDEADNAGGDATSGIRALNEQA